MSINEPAEYAILGLLKLQPMHGYEMFQHFDTGVLHEIIHLEMSQMYAFLKKLERLRYITAEYTERGARPPRRVFHLTREGETLFMCWLTEPVARPRDVRIVFLLKLYFSRHFCPDQTPSLIQRQTQACQQFLQKLESLQPRHNASADDLFLNQVVLSSRIHQTRALVQWLCELQLEPVIHQ